MSATFIVSMSMRHVASGVGPGLGLSYLFDAALRPGDSGRHHSQDRGAAMHMLGRYQTVEDCIMHVQMSRSMIVLHLSMYCCMFVG